MRKRYILVLFWMCLIQYSEANILLSDTFVLFSPTTKSRRIEITNISQKSKRYRVSFIHYRQLENGAYEKINADNTDIQFAQPLLHVSPRSFFLKPRETQTIRLFKKKAAFLAAESGEFRSHLLVREMMVVEAKTAQNHTNSDSLSINISALMGMSVPVIMQKGVLSHKTGIISANVVLKDDIPHLDLHLKRHGRASSRGNVNIYLDNQKIGLAKHINILAPLEIRRLQIPLYENADLSTPATKSSLWNKTLRIIYLEKHNYTLTPISEISHTVVF